MTDLTDKWNKGELPSGWYWVDYYSVDGAVMLEYIPQHNGFGYEEKELVQAVLAPVPSYEEYQALLSDQLAKNEGVEINAELEAIIKKREIKIKELYETIDKFADSNLDLIKNIETLAQKLLQVKPELREWLEVNYGEYL